MKLGIVSDTHRYFHPNLKDAFSEVDEIFHAGDIGSLDVMDELDKIAPTSAVYGNIDGKDIRKIYPKILEREIHGKKIMMIHIAGRPGRWYPKIQSMLEEKKPDLFICGMLFLNPGAAGRQGIHRVKTCARIQIDDDGFSELQVVHLDES